MICFKFKHSGFIHVLRVHASVYRCECMGLPTSTQIAAPRGPLRACMTIAPRSDTGLRGAQAPPSDSHLASQRGHPGRHGLSGGHCDVLRIPPGPLRRTLPLHVSGHMSGHLFGHMLCCVLPVAAGNDVGEDPDQALAAAATSNAVMVGRRIRARTYMSLAAARGTTPARCCHIAAVDASYFCDLR